MPGLDPKVEVHHVAVENGARPVKQAQRRFRLDLVPLIESEVKKLIEVGFIREVKYPTWISIIILVKRRMAKFEILMPLKRAMQNIFDDLLQENVEFYVDDLVVKSRKRSDQLKGLRMVPELLRKYQLRMNLLKCAFGVTSEEFLGFIVRHR
ncbi:uncharacterized protein [Nicotiana tomentosiformis]|uniref:uncharacterized protein n=1 Tax=Nicotiana tomentosiformis TaxID=4098 RepID=UPI00388C95BF